MIAHEGYCGPSINLFVCQCTVDLEGRCIKTVKTEMNLKKRKFKYF